MAPPVWRGQRTASAREFAENRKKTRKKRLRHIGVTIRLTYSDGAVVSDGIRYFNNDPWNQMAIKKAAAKKAAPAKSAKPVAAKPAAAKPIKEALSKTGLLAHVADASGVELKSVRKVLAALEEAISASVSKKGAGAFVLPGFLKINTIKVPAKPKRKGINPFTKEEQWFAAKPASLKIKIRPLKKLKDAAA